MLALHVWQSALPLPGACVPGEHGTSALLLAGHCVPGAHVIQSDSCVRRGRPP